MMRARQADGIAKAKERGACKDASRASLTDEQAQEARDRLAACVAKARVARDLGVSRSTLYGIWTHPACLLSHVHT